ncbi:tRNA-dihydrouridine(16/17) synthase [NAD(P)] [Trifolium repens]|nr:tRNA-dihydrouridine(16/17) synthase [NAD(P)] [Trifolium repens]
MAQTRTSSDSTQPEQQQHPPRNLTLTGEDSRVQRAWTHWNNLGRPKLIVAPMVDNSELPFRMLCRKYGDQAAYTPLVRCHGELYAPMFINCWETGSAFSPISGKILINSIKYI